MGRLSGRDIPIGSAMKSCQISMRKCKGLRQKKAGAQASLFLPFNHAVERSIAALVGTLYNSPHIHRPWSILLRP
jgi:hypothetical protein